MFEKGEGSQTNTILGSLHHVKTNSRSENSIKKNSNGKMIDTAKYQLADSCPTLEVYTFKEQVYSNSWQVRHQVQGGIQFQFFFTSASDGSLFFKCEHIHTTSSIDEHVIVYNFHNSHGRKIMLGDDPEELQLNLYFWKSVLTCRGFSHMLAPLQMQP